MAEKKINKKTNTITRKIQLNIDSDKEQVKEIWKKLRIWNNITFRAYNFTATHLYLQKNISDFFYFNEDFKLSLTKRTEEKPDGVFKTSYPNTTYQLLSSKFKGDIPTDILTNVNQRVTLAFNAEKDAYSLGTKSLRTYSSDVPIPFSSTSIRNIRPFEDEKGKVNYTFTLFDIPFRTYFGSDRSGNREIFQRGLSGEYHFAGSTIQLTSKGIFLLLSIQFKSEQNKLNDDKTAYAYLSFNYPIELVIGKKTYQIGTKEGYLHQRLAIKGARSRLQKNLRFTAGGHGRADKLKALNAFEQKELNYIETILHKYSKNLVDLCVKNKVGYLVLSLQGEENKSIQSRIKEIEENEELTKREKSELIEKAKFVISNWSYYGLTQKIDYKAKIAGLKVIVEKETAIKK